MIKHYLLLSMIGFYIIPISLICYYYKSNTSISNIICNDDYKNIILIFMLFMGIVTILYEIERNDSFSIFVIGLLLISTYAVICIKDTNKLHFLFAFSVFISILLFMMRHCYVKKCNYILLFSLFLEIITFFFIINNINKDMFLIETIYILNFAFYYLYLHFIENKLPNISFNS